MRKEECNFLKIDNYFSIQNNQTFKHLFTISCLVGVKCSALRGNYTLLLSNFVLDITLKQIYESA